MEATTPVRSAVTLSVAALLLLPYSSCAFQPTPPTIMRPSLILNMNPTSDGVIPEVDPLSRKKAMLIEQAKEMGATSGSYSSVGWSNRLGSVLTPASIPGVYTADRPFYWNKIDVGGRMTVIRLQTSASSSSSDDDPVSDLVVHSPVALDPPLVAALNGLGRVAHVISPNYEHVKYASQWAERYPAAKMWGCPGLTEREPNTRWTGEVPFGARPLGFAREEGAVVADACDEMWDWGELQPLHIDTEVNPFTGRPFFNEVVYYHAPSKTLLTTDFYWNYPRGDGVTNGQIVDELEKKGIMVKDIGAGLQEEGDFGEWELAPNVGDIPVGSRLWGKVGMDKLFYPFYMNLMVKNDKRDAFEKIARFITCAGDGNGNNIGWEVETIIPCHGDIIRGKELCRIVLETHFNIHCSARG